MEVQSAKVKNKVQRVKKNCDGFSLNLKNLNIQWNVCLAFSKP